MKKILFIFSMILVFQVQASAQFTQATLQASGLTCAMCSNAINKAVQKLDFVEKVTPNISESSFSIAFKKDGNVSFDEIRKAVEDAGFSVANLTVNASFDNVAVTNDAHITVDGKVLHFLEVKSQTLTGVHTIKLVDKKFVSDKLHKKYAATTKMDCVKTGVMENCCSKPSLQQKGTKVYHVTI